MKMRIHLISSSSVILLSLIISLMTVGCSSDSSGGNTSNGITTSTASLGTSVKNVQLVNGVQSEISFTYMIPGDISSKGDFSVNLTKTLQNITLSSSPIASNTSKFETLKLLAYALVKEAFAATPSTAEITVYISFAGDPNVCSSPYSFGPYSITGMIGSALTSDTTSVTPTEPAVDISNAGSFEICVKTIPPIDAFLTVTGVAVDFEPCAEATADIVGAWTGTFQCTSFGETVPDDSPMPISLTITRNADGSYHYNDTVADYDGHLCGNKYKFNGGLADDYTESGTLVFNGNDATKTSTWLSTIYNDVGGRCSDDLKKSL